MMVTTLYIDGMRSVHCARAVLTSLTRIEEIVGAQVVLGKAVLDHAAALDRRVLSVAVEEMGYTLREIVTERRRLPLHPRTDATGDETAG